MAEMAITGSKEVLNRFLSKEGIVGLDIQGGDTRLTWSRNNDAEVDNARRTFDTLIAKNYTAYRLDTADRRGERIHAFDAGIERMILIPQVAGG
jgi:hypothetical protein